MTTPTTPLYRIKNWEAIYEWVTTRGNPTAPLKWIKVQTKQGTGYRNLVTHARGDAHYGAWLALLQVASRCFPRGVLIQKDGRPHTAASLSKESLLPSKTFAELLPRLLDQQDVGWIEQIPVHAVSEFIDSSVAHARAGAAPGPRDLRGRGSEDRKEEEEEDHSLPELNPKGKTVERASSDKPTRPPQKARTKSPAKSSALQPIDDDYLAGLQSSEAYREINVRREYLRMVEWCKTRHKIPSRRRLINWLNRTETPMRTTDGKSERHNQTPAANATDRRSDRLRERNYEEIARRSVRHADEEE